MKNRLVYVIDWGKQYSTLTRVNNETNEMENIFPIKTILPNYCGVEYHWKCVYEPNLTLKGTVNKKEPTKLVEKIPVYKNYKWEILETFKHPSGYTDENLLLLASTHTDVDYNKCYIVIGESGVSELTPKQYLDKQFNAIIESNLNKWDRKTLNRDRIPEEIISRFYDKDDNVLFGSSMTKGLVSYEYLDSKFSIDGKPIFIRSSVLYDGEGNSKCPNPELIKPFSWIKKHLE